MAERDFKAAMMADPVLAKEAGLPEPEDDGGDMRCPMCGASAKKIAQAAMGGMGGGGGMMGGMKGGM